MIWLKRVDPKPKKVGHPILICEESCKIWGHCTDRADCNRHGRCLHNTTDVGEYEDDQ